MVLVEATAKLPGEAEERSSSPSWQWTHLAMSSLLWWEVLAQTLLAFQLVDTTAVGPEGIRPAVAAEPLIFVSRLTTFPTDSS